MEFEINRGRDRASRRSLGFKRKGNDDWDYMIDKENKIGYIRLTQFTRTSYAEILRGDGKLVSAGHQGLRPRSPLQPGRTCSTAPSRSPTCSSTTA